MSNVDAAEIARFDRIAATWWDPQGEMAPLHAINPLRVKYLEQCADGLDGRRVLDVGCGGGLLSEALAARGATVTGIDLAEDVLAAARRHLGESKLKVQYRAVAAETLAAEAPASFDLVSCLEMLEHVPDPAAVVKACGQLVRPGGTVVFSTINRTGKAYLLAILGAEYVLRLIPRGTHDYAKFIRPSELERWARDAGLDAAEVRGLIYNPVLKSASWGDDVGVNYFMRCARPSE
jgi:2-polyprenyl-6-hydroxyphenyl methylase/3-demethylubiquinone-9 3-methyltransferase